MVLLAPWSVTQQVTEGWRLPFRSDTTAESCDCVYPSLNLSILVVASCRVHPFYMAESFKAGVKHQTPLVLCSVPCSGNHSCSAGSVKYNDTDPCWGVVTRKDAYRVFLVGTSERLHRSSASCFVCVCVWDLARSQLGRSRCRRKFNMLMNINQYSYHICHSSSFNMTSHFSGALNSRSILKI